MISRELRVDSGSTQTGYFLSVPLQRLFYEADFIEAVVVDADCINAGHYKEDEKAPTGEAAYDVPHAHASLNCRYQIQHPISELKFRQSSDRGHGSVRQSSGKTSKHSETNRHWTGSAGRANQRKTRHIRK
jgi:hypothetical protein